MRCLRWQSAREDVRHLKVDSLEGINNSSVVMLSRHLEGQSGSDHIQRVGTYHCGHTCQRATLGQWPGKHSSMVCCHCATAVGCSIEAGLLYKKKKKKNTAGTDWYVLSVPTTALPAIEPATRRWMCPEIPICLLRSYKRRRERSRVFPNKNNEQTFIGTLTDPKLQKQIKGTVQTTMTQRGTVPFYNCQRP